MDFLHAGYECFFAILTLKRKNMIIMEAARAQDILPFHKIFEGQIVSAWGTAQNKAYRLDGRPYKTRGTWAKRVIRILYRKKRKCGRVETIYCTKTQTHQRRRSRVGLF